MSEINVSPAIEQTIAVDPAAGPVKVISRTQRLIVNPSTKAVAVVNAGPMGPRGLTGPTDVDTVLTADGQLLTRILGSLAPVTRADLAADPAFVAAFAAALAAHAAASDPHPGYVTTAEGATLISNHEALANPHPGYLTPAEGDAVYVPLTQKGANNGVATLGATGVVPQTQMSASSILALLLGVDGAGSGIDADLLDGKQGNTYLYSNDSANIVQRGSTTSAAFAGAAPSTASGTITFPVAFSGTPIVVAWCTAITGNATTVLNAAGITSSNFGYRAALIAGSSTSTVTIHWIAIGPA